MRKVTDDEIQSINAVCEELLKFAFPARRRILGYVCARLADEDGGPPHIAFRTTNGEADVRDHD